MALVAAPVMAPTPQPLRCTARSAGGDDGNKLSTLAAVAVDLLDHGADFAPNKQGAAQQPQRQPGGQQASRWPVQCTQGQQHSRPNQPHNLQVQIQHQGKPPADGTPVFSSGVARAGTKQQHQPLFLVLPVHNAQQHQEVQGQGHDGLPRVMQAYGVVASPPHPFRSSPIGPAQQSPVTAVPSPQRCVQAAGSPSAAAPQRSPLPHARCGGFMISAEEALAAAPPFRRESSLPGELGPRVEYKGARRCSAEDIAAAEAPAVGVPLAHRPQSRRMYVPLASLGERMGPDQQQCVTVMPAARGQPPLAVAGAAKEVQRRGQFASSTMSINSNATAAAVAANCAAVARHPLANLPVVVARSPGSTLVAPGRELPAGVWQTAAANAPYPLSVGRSGAGTASSAAAALHRGGAAMGAHHPAGPAACAATAPADVARPLHPTRPPAPAHQQRVQGPYAINYTAAAGSGAARESAHERLPIPVHAPPASTPVGVTASGTRIMLPVVISAPSATPSASPFTSLAAAWTPSPAAAAVEAAAAHAGRRRRPYEPEQSPQGHEQQSGGVAAKRPRLAAEPPHTAMLAQLSSMAAATRSSSPAAAAAQVQGPQACKYRQSPPSARMHAAATAFPVPIAVLRAAAPTAVADVGAAAPWGRCAPPTAAPVEEGWRYVRDMAGVAVGIPSSGGGGGGGHLCSGSSSGGAGAAAAQVLLVPASAMAGKQQQSGGSSSCDSWSSGASGVCALAAANAAGTGRVLAPAAAAVATARSARTGECHGEEEHPLSPAPHVSEAHVAVTFDQRREPNGLGCGSTHSPSGPQQQQQQWLAWVAEVVAAAAAHGPSGQSGSAGVADGAWRGTARGVQQQEQEQRVRAWKDKVAAFGMVAAAATAAPGSSEGAGRREQGHGSQKGLVRGLVPEALRHRWEETVEEVAAAALQRCFALGGGGGDGGRAHGGEASGRAWEHEWYLKVSAVAAAAVQGA